MAKYNITEPKERTGNYKLQLSAALIDDLEKKIFEEIRVKEKYKERGYNASKLANDIKTNVRYISAVMGVRFGMNYTTFVNSFRVEKAMQMMRDKRYAEYTMEDICNAIGFSNRQSFYAAFYKVKNMTPREFKDKYGIGSVNKEKK